MSLLEDVDVSDNFMVITVIVETGCVLRLLWMFARVDRLLRLCQNLRQQLPQLTRIFRLCKFKACVQKDLTDEEKMVSEEVAHTQLRIARYFVRGYAIMFWLITITIQWKIVFDQPRWLPAMIPWATMISAAALTMGALFDSLLTTRTLNIWYCLCMLQTAAVTSPLAVPSYLLPIFWLMSFAFVRLPASMFIASSTPLAVVLNLCLSPLVWSRICLQRVELGDVDISILVFSFELIGCALAVAASPCAKSLLRTRVEQGVRCGKMETDLRAASALLSLTCDAVLELDSEMRLASHSPELAACLLRNGQGTSLKGTRFTDFMPPSDAEQAAMMMQRASCSEPFRVHVFHTRMVDSCSSKFRTEVFQVSYTKWDGHLSHLHLSLHRVFLQPCDVAHLWAHCQAAS
ncbi:unnamed protein product [Effrenium voratum]|uniref:Uncharacterized protein n=1 Tax=Effrenium voratum TaxID=2562239 RepID=A0AA36NLN9_9DINO|nr:unnamed protein product [Effrenium voratum]